MSNWVFTAVQPVHFRMNSSLSRPPKKILDPPVWVFAHLIGNIADDAMQMDVHKTLYPFYTTKKMTHVTVTITKNASLAAIAMYINITTIYTVRNLQTFNAGHFFSSKHCNDLQRKKHWIAMVFNENTNHDFILLSKQGRTQLIYSTDLTTEHGFENFGG